MTNKTILQRAIERVIKQGWNPIDDMGDVHEFRIHRTDGSWQGIWVVFETGRGDGGSYNIIRILFDIDLGFAKALGYKLTELGAWCDEGKEPLKYLERFLTGGEK